MQAKFLIILVLVAFASFSTAAPVSTGQIALEKRGLGSFFSSAWRRFGNIFRSKSKPAPNHNVVSNGVPVQTPQVPHVDAPRKGMSAGSALAVGVGGM